MNSCLDYPAVVCQLEERKKKLAIAEIIETCTVFENLPNKDQFIENVLKRETIETTGIGNGVAIAHGKVKKLSHIKVALGLCPEGIEFDSKDNQPVKFLFVIASSPTRQFEYIKTISSILRIMREAKLRDELLSVAEQNSSFDVLSEKAKALIKMLRSQRFRYLLLN